MKDRAVCRNCVVIRTSTVYPDQSKSSGRGGKPRWAALERSVDTPDHITKSKHTYCVHCFTLCGYIATGGSSFSAEGSPDFRPQGILRTQTTNTKQPFSRCYVVRQIVKPT